MSFVETYAEQGCLVIDRLFDPALIDRVRAEYDRQCAPLDPDERPPHMVVGDRRVHWPIRLTGALLDPALYAHPILLRILASLLGGNFLIDNAVCVVALPCAAEQKVHRDHSLLFSEQGAESAALPPFAITVAIPLIDLDEATGTTLLYPGSLGAMCDADGHTPAFDKEIRPFVKRGGCFLMDYRLWHRGLANRSRHDRPILYLIFAREWFTDVRNFKEHARLLVDGADLARIPDEHRPLFRRLAAKGLHDLSIKQVLGQA